MVPGKIKPLRTTKASRPSWTWFTRNRSGATTAVWLTAHVRNSQVVWKRRALLCSVPMKFAFCWVSLRFVCSISLHEERQTKRESSVACQLFEKQIIHLHSWFVGLLMTCHCVIVLFSALHRQNSAWNFPAIRSWEMERVTTKTMPFPSCGVCSLSASTPTKGHTLILVLHILGVGVAMGRSWWLRHVALVAPCCSSVSWLKFISCCYGRIWQELGHFSSTSAKLHFWWLDSRFNILRNRWCYFPVLLATWMILGCTGFGGVVPAPWPWIWIWIYDDLWCFYDASMMLLDDIWHLKKHVLTKASSARRSEEIAFRRRSWAFRSTLPETRQDDTYIAYICISYAYYSKVHIAGCIAGFIPHDTRPRSMHFFEDAPPLSPTDLMQMRRCAYLTWDRHRQTPHHPLVLWSFGSMLFKSTCIEVTSVPSEISRPRRKWRSARFSSEHMPLVSTCQLQLALWAVLVRPDMTRLILLVKAVLGARMHYGHPDIMNKPLGEAKGSCGTFKQQRYSVVTHWKLRKAAPQHDMIMTWSWHDHDMIMTWYGMHLESSWNVSETKGSSWCSKEAFPKQQRRWTFRRTFSQDPWICWTMLQDVL